MRAKGKTKQGGERDTRIRVGSKQKEKCASVCQHKDTLKHHIPLLSVFQNCKPVQNLPDADAVQTVGRWEDRLPGRPSGEICGELHHQKPSGEDTRL